MATFKRK